MPEVINKSDEQSKAAFVWRSTEESIRYGVPSALACLEVIGAVAAYWAIAVYFETFTHLWMSICVAPLLLLRSDQSIALGVEWFTIFNDGINKQASVFFEQGNNSIFRTRAFWAAAPIVFITSVGFSYLFARYWLSEYKNWGQLWRGFIAEFIALQFGLIAGAVVGTALTPGGALLSAAAALPILVIAAIVIGVVAGPVAALGGIVVAPMSFFIAGPAIIFYGSFAIRFAATARHVQSGFWDIPKNFTQALFVVDFHHHPELVPGYFKDVKWTIGGLLNRFQEPQPIWMHGITVVILLLCAVPAYLYRLSIKSTCWLYLPIVYIASGRDFAFSGAHLLDRLARSPLERLRRWLAMGTLAGFIIAIFVFNFTRLPDLFTARLVSPIEFFFVLDFPWKKPWQAFNLFSAALTLYLWLQAGEARIDQGHAQDAKTQALFARSIEWIKFLMRLRNVSSALLILILFGHVLLAFSPIMKWLPTYILRGLSWIYGDYMPTAQQ